MKTIKEKATSLALWAITFLGGYLVGEQLLSGEQLAEIQGIVGMSLAGGGLTLGTVIYVLKVIAPTKAAEVLVEKVGADKINKVFNTIDSFESTLSLVVSKLEVVEKELLETKAERDQIKNDLGL